MGPGLSCSFVEASLPKLTRLSEQGEFNSEDMCPRNRILDGASKHGKQKHHFRLRAWTVPNRARSWKTLEGVNRGRLFRRWPCCGSADNDAKPHSKKCECMPIKMSGLPTRLAMSMSAVPATSLSKLACRQWRTEAQGFQLPTFLASNELLQKELKMGGFCWFSEQDQRHLAWPRQFFANHG
jgi:hypothetical protein